MVHSPPCACSATVVCNVLERAAGSTIWGRGWGGRRRASACSLVCSRGWSWGETCESLADVPACCCSPCCSQGYAWACCRHELVPGSYLAQLCVRRHVVADVFLCVVLGVARFACCVWGSHRLGGCGAVVPFALLPVPLVFTEGLGKQLEMGGGDTDGTRMWYNYGVCLTGTLVSMLLAMPVVFLHLKLVSSPLCPIVGL